MLPEVASAASVLDGLASHLETVWVEGPFQRAQAGWNVPPLSRRDLSDRIKLLSGRLKGLADDSISDELRARIVNLPEQIGWFQSQTLPQLPSANLQIVVSIFDSIISNIEPFIPNSPDWVELEKSSLIPKELARRIRSLENSLSRLEPRAVNLEGQIQRIDEAHSAAMDLPTDMAALKEARDEIASSASRVDTAIKNITQAEFASAGFVAMLEEKRDTVDKLISNIDSAYSAATTIGLAGAFKERADQLSRTTWVWVLILFVALSAGGIIGFYRINELQQSIAQENFASHWIVLNATMSILSIAAPVWIAWLSTRQIGQRFRLAEDYAFKASVARAYEGYRKEAARLDPKLEARLFASALDRLEEAPLRFISVEEYSSPYEALLASSGFQKLIDKLPSVDREAFMDTLSKMPGRGKKNRNKRPTIPPVPEVVTEVAQE